MRGKASNRLLVAVVFLAPLLSAACGVSYSSPPLRLLDRLSELTR